MTIIGTGKIQNCESCHTTFLYEEKDIKADQRHFEERNITYSSYFVECPVCDNKIFIKEKS